MMELVQLAVVEVEEPVLLVRAPVLVVGAVKVHWQSQDSLVNSELFLP